MSWDVIIPFLRPIEGLIRDPEISDILVNGPDHVFVEKFGEMKAVPGVTLNFTPTLAFTSFALGS